MATVATYLNLPGTTEQAFEFYKTVFGTDFSGDGIMRMGNVPRSPDEPEMSAEDQRMVMHVTLPILGDHMLMGSDVPDNDTGSAVSIMLCPDNPGEADALFAKLNDGATNVEPMQDMFWGDYYGHLTDRFGVHWMLDVPSAGQ
ncbi:MAG: VOC family protein [Ilumatobacteraceae bacterium]